MAKKRRLPRVRGLLGPAALRSKRPIRKKSEPEHRKRSDRDSWNSPLLNASPSLTSWGFSLIPAEHPA